MNSPPGRHQFHEERLMRQIHDDRRAPAGPPAAIAAGRQGVAVARLGPTSGQRTEGIFDRGP